MKTTVKSFEVFEFKEEAEPEPLEFAVRNNSKLENPNAIDKYKLLESVAQGIKIASNETGNVPCVDVNAMDSDHNGDNAISYASLEAEEDSSTKRMPEFDDFRQTSSAVAEELLQSRANELEPKTVLSGAENIAAGGAASPSKCRLNCSFPDSLSIDEVLDMVPDANERMSSRSPSTSSDIAKDDVVLDGPSSDHSARGWETEDENIAVVLHPDYMLCADKYCTDCVVTFCSSCIELTGSTAYEDQEAFRIQWAIDDIIHIESTWYERIQMTMVKIRVLSKDAVEAEDVDGTLGTELKFAVIGSDWYKKLEAITSLNVMYKGLWSSMLDTGMEQSCRGAVLGNTRVFSTKYFPNFDEPFEEVVYPKGDSDAVSISKRDVDLLQPDTFVNDTIIDFYIKYLKNKIKPEERHRFHFFNSFFFRKLADPDKDPSNASGGRAAFQRVRKWTRKVNLFEKDFVFIPVNFNYHWSLIVMCHLGEVATFQDEDVKKWIKVPCILHMDSIRGSHTGLKDLVQSYLWEEWKERHSEASEDISSRFHNLRFVSLELPQQQNSFDCGLFLLHYVELFLEQVPGSFNPFKITKSSNFLNVDWFEPAEASIKRVVIQRLIYDLLENHSQETPPADDNDEHCTLNCEKTTLGNNTDARFVPEKCSPPKDCHRTISSSEADEGVAISLLPSSSVNGSQCANDPGPALRDLFEPGLLLETQYSAFNRTAPFNEFKSSLTPIEEEVEAAGRFVYSPSTETGLQQLSGITPEGCTFPYSPRDLRFDTSWKCGISGHETGIDEIESSVETSISGCEDSIEEVNENSQADEVISLKGKIDHPRSPLTESSTQPAEMLLDGNANCDNLTASPENLPPAFSPRDSDMQENGCIVSEDSSGLKLDLMHVAKKMRFTPPIGGEGEGGLTSSVSNDLHL